MEIISDKKFHETFELVDKLKAQNVQLTEECYEHQNNVTKLQVENEKLKNAIREMLHHCEKYNRSEESFILAMEIEKLNKVLKNCETSTGD